MSNWETNVKSKEEKCPEAGLAKQTEQDLGSGIGKVIPDTTVSSSHPGPLVKVKVKAKVKVVGVEVEGKIEAFRKRAILRGATRHLGYNCLSQ